MGLFIDTFINTSFLAYPMKGNKPFERALETVEILRERCAADRVRDVDEIVENLKEELDEVKEEIEKEESEKIIEELGDLLWNVLFLIKVERDNHHFSYDRVFEKMTNKMRFRHPHVFRDKVDVSAEEAHRIWDEQKRIERDEKIIH